MLLSIFIGLFPACRQAKKNLSIEDVSFNLLLKNKPELIKQVGRPTKTQSRTGGVIALYFIDKKSGIVFILDDQIVVEIIISQKRESALSLDYFLPNDLWNWIIKEEIRFDDKVTVYHNIEQNISIFEDDGSIYMTTNWWNEKQ